MCERILVFSTSSRLLQRSNEQPRVKTQYRVQGTTSKMLLILWVLDWPCVFNLTAHWFLKGPLPTILYRTVYGSFQAHRTPHCPYCEVVQGEAGFSVTYRTMETRWQKLVLARSCPPQHCDWGRVGPTNPVSEVTWCTVCCDLQSKSACVTGPQEWQWLLLIWL